MKFNWGLGITIAIGGFMAFILYLVISVSGVHTDLVSTDYYDQELNYQETINAKHRGEVYRDSVELKVGEQMVLLKFPRQFVDASVNGKVHFYCANNAAEDMRFPLQINTNGDQFISREHFTSDHYQLTLFWEMGGVDYRLSYPLNLD